MHIHNANAPISNRAYGSLVEYCHRWSTHSVVIQSRCAVPPWEYSVLQSFNKNWLNTDYTESSTLPTITCVKEYYPYVKLIIQYTP